MNLSGDTDHGAGGLGEGVWVSIEGKALDLADVAELFAQSSTVRLCGEDGAFYITAPELETLTTDVERRDRAAEIIQLVNGAARLHWSNHHPLTPGQRVVTIDNDGHRHESQVVHVGSAEAHVRFGAIAPTISVAAAHPSTRVEDPQSFAFVGL